MLQYILVTVLGGVVGDVSTYSREADAVQDAEDFCENNDPEDADCAVYEQTVKEQSHLSVCWTPKGRTFNEIKW